MMFGNTPERTTKFRVKLASFENRGTLNWNASKVITIANTPSLKASSLLVVIVNVLLTSFKPERFVVFNLIPGQVYCP